MNALLRRLAAFILVALFCAPALAQPGSQPGWETEKKAGDAAFKQRRYGDALEHYEKAWSIEQKPVLNYNRGRAYESLGRYPEALTQFEAFIERAPADLKAKVPQLDELVEATRQKVSTITIITDPPGAQVLLDGVRLGVTPIENKRVNAGRVELELTRKDFLPLRETVTLAGNSAVPLTRTLKPLIEGELFVETDPPGATVILDGQTIGLSPLRREVARGAHEIRVELDGYDTIEDTITMQPGKKENFNTTLKSSELYYETWWFWTSIGGAVAIGGGIAATLVAVNTEKSPTKGSIDPGLVRAPITGTSILQITF